MSTGVYKCCNIRLFNTWTHMCLLEYLVNAFMIHTVADILSSPRGNLPIRIGTTERFRLLLDRRVDVIAQLFDDLVQ